MEFGEWVRDIRQQKKLDIRTFAELTGVDSSTVSRIENLHTQAMMLTAVRICEGLEISPEKLLGILQNKQFPGLQESYFIEDKKTINIEFLETFVNKFKQDEASQIEILVNHLNDLSKIISSSEPYISLPDIEEIKFTKDVAKYLFSTSPLFSPLKISYPPMKLNELLYIYKRKGALMPGEAEVYTHNIRTKGRSRLPFGSSIGSSSVGIFTSSLDRVKFSDVVKFDVEMEQEGVVVGMYWEACKFYDHFRYIKNGPEYKNFIYAFPSFAQKPGIERGMERPYSEARLAETYLKIYRWFQSLGEPDFSMGDK